MPHSLESLVVPEAEPAETPSSFARTVALLGGRQVFRKAIKSKLDVHEALQKGIPGGALVYLTKHIETLKPAEVGHAVGLSIRTVQRRAGTPRKLLNKDQSSRTWKFAEILTTATQVFGSQSEAERWLVTPAMALNQRRPVDLLASSAGVELVEQLLGRLEYGVYT